MPEPYHMIAYIREGGAALQRTLDGNEAVVAALVERARRQGVRRLVVLGLGSSWTAARMAEPLFRYHCPLPAHLLPATEADAYAPRLLDQETMAVVISRSGERGPVVSALQEAVARGALGVAMTGYANSLLAQQAQVVLVTGEGPEITFPKTKSVLACAGLLMRLGLAFAPPDDGEAISRLSALRAMPGCIERTVRAIEPAVQALIPSLQALGPVAVVGTGSNYGAALEMAIKLQETANVPTLPNDSGNLFFGPLGAMGERWLLISLVTRQDLDVSKSLLRLAGSFHPRRLGITEPGLELGGLAEFTLPLPEPVDPLLAALAFLAPLHLLTYHWALARGMNVDAPACMDAMLAAMLPPGREEPELRQSP